jgi:hypothetical protein
MSLIFGCAARVAVSLGPSDGATDSSDRDLRNLDRHVKDVALVRPDPVIEAGHTSTTFERKQTWKITKPSSSKTTSPQSSIPIPSPETSSSLCTTESEQATEPTPATSAWSCAKTTPTNSASSDRHSCIPEFHLAMAQTGVQNVTIALVATNDLLAVSAWCSAFSNGRCSWGVSLCLDCRRLDSSLIRRCQDC